MITRGVRAITIAIAVAAPIVLGGPNAGVSVALDHDCRTAAVDSSVNVQAGARLTVAVWLADVVDLDGFAVVLKFDPTMLKFALVQKTGPAGERGFMETDGGTLSAFLAKARAGELDIAATLIGNDRNQAPDGSGVVAYVTFSVLTTGQVRVGVAEASVVDSDLACDVIVKR